MSAPELGAAGRGPSTELPEAAEVPGAAEVPETAEPRKVPEGKAPTAVVPSTETTRERTSAARRWWRAGGPPLDLGPAVLAVLGTWIGSRIAVLIASLLGARAVRNPSASRVPDLVTIWNHWDVGLFVKVAEFGYLSPAYADRTEVDFPGLPLAMRIVHPLVGNWVVAGLVVSLVAGLIASAALWRLAVDDGIDDAATTATAVRNGAPADPADRGRRAVLLLVCFPYAVFLFAGYSEGLFFAFATTAWVAARRERWAIAGLCAAGATATRVLGLALLAGLWVEYLLSVWRARRRSGGTWAWRRRPAQVAWLLLPLAPIVAFLAYFQVRTGHWNAYTQAMKEHWGRTVALPWDGFLTTWRQALSTDQATAFRVFWWAELLAVAIGIALVVALMRYRRWGEATYVGGCTLIMSCSSYWASGVRAVLVWFPLYLLLARRPKVVTPYLWVCAPAAVVFVVAFSSGVWVD